MARNTRVAMSGVPRAVCALSSSQLTISAESGASSVSACTSSSSTSSSTLSSWNTSSSRAAASRTELSRATAFCALGLSGGGDRGALLVRLLCGDLGGVKRMLWGGMSTSLCLLLFIIPPLYRFHCFLVSLVSFNFVWEFFLTVRCRRLLLTVPPFCFILCLFFFFRVSLFIGFIYTPHFIYTIFL